MPPRTRKSTGGARGSPAGTQRKLSFNHRVTKSVPKTLAKDSIAGSPLRKELLRDKIDAELAAEEEEVKEVEATPEPEPVRQITPKVAEKSDLERKAEKLGDAAINRYWRTVEGEMMSKRVHQEDLSTGEKVLRYFDVCSQYGVSLLLLFYFGHRLTKRGYSHASASNA